MKRCILSLFILFSINLAFGQSGQKIKISTDLGDMIILLYDDTPIHRDNFIKNVSNGWYDGTLFHRVIPGFMMQGGDPNSIGATSTQSLGADRCPKLKAEILPKYFHKKGALAAARQPDSVNPEKASSGCQFFIVQGYKQTDTQLNSMETANFKFPDIHRANYKVRGGYPFLDMQYTIFGEVIEGLEVIDLICAMPTGKNVKDRPNSDIKMKVTLID